MRCLLAPIVVVVAAPAAAIARESLCSPCIDAPIDRIDRPDPFRSPFRGTRATTVITAEDMRRLGVVAVADMVNQLPSRITAGDPAAVVAEPRAAGADADDPPAAAASDTASGTDTAIGADPDTATASGTDPDPDPDPDASAGPRVRAGNRSAEDASATAE